MPQSYKNNYLTNAIVRIDLPTTLTGLDNGVPNNIARYVLKKFPILEPQQIAEGTIQFSPNDISAATTRRLKVWNYHGKDREKTFSLGENFMSIEYKKYKSYENFKEDFIHILGLLAAEFSELQINRFGMRYINSIEIKESRPTNWSEYISPNLLSIFNVVQDDEKLTRAFQILATVKDDINLTFQYGMHNPDFPSAIKRKLFVLDIDAYQQGALTKNDIESNLDKYHSKIKSYFESSITDALRRKMNHGRTR